MYSLYIIIHITKFEVCDPRSLLTRLMREESPEKFRPERDLNPDLCDACAVLKLV